MEDNIFKFEDFLTTKSSKLEDIKKLLEDIQNDSFDIDETGIDESETFINESIQLEEVEPVDTEETVIEETPEEVEEEVEEDVEEVIESETENYYNLYSDKSENFICDISIKGADPTDSQARIVIESSDWTLMFYGELKDGKCIVPIKKLNILKEGQIGDIRLEVIAEGNLFIPWEDKFKVKLSKKVTVKINEQRDAWKKPSSKSVGVNVKVKK